MQNLHKPVLTKELTAELPNLAGNYLDATLGSGGHALAIVEHSLKLAKKSSFLGCDLDGNAWLLFKQRLKIAELDFQQKSGELVIGGRLPARFMQVNFARLAESKEIAETNYACMVADLGLSQNQIANIPGLSFRQNTALDMRYDGDLGVTASDLIRVLSVGQLTKLFRDYGDIEFAPKLARALKAPANSATTTWELNAIVLEVLKEIGLLNGADYAADEKLIKAGMEGQVKFSQTAAKDLARIYQALRIAVNLEFQNLTAFLEFAANRLVPQGRILILTFHSGEQRLISRFCKQPENKIRFRYKVKQPSAAELIKNPRSRSAQLNVISRLG